MVKSTITLIPCGNHAHIRGANDVERLMSTLAYGWVERCSDVAGCGTNSFKMSILDYFVSAIIFTD